MDSETITIDCTPTWSGWLPALLLVYTNSKTAQAQQEAMEELTRMAQLADLYVKSQK